MMGNPKSQTSAFSLVELLVVVTIIAILASLLLPGLAQTKRLAKSTKCKSNLRQIGTSLTLYTHDYGAYPISSANTAAHWDKRLNAYLQQVNEAPDGLGGVWLCPAERTKHDRYKSGSYGYNVNGIEQPHLALGLGGNLPRVENFFSRPTLESEVKVPSDMIAIGDGFLSALSGTLFSRSEVLGRSFEPPTGKKTSLGMREALGRHRGSLNIIFCDSHAEGLKVRALFLDKTDASLKRWNKDNESHFTPAEK